MQIGSQTIRFRGFTESHSQRKNIKNQPWKRKYNCKLTNNADRDPLSTLTPSWLTQWLIELRKPDQQYKMLSGDEHKYWRTQVLVRTDCIYPHAALLYRASYLALDVHQRWHTLSRF